MKDENSVPAAQKMTDVSLSIFRSKFKKTRIQMIDYMRLGVRARLVALFSLRWPVPNFLGQKEASTLSSGFSTKVGKPLAEYSLSFSCWTPLGTVTQLHRNTCQPERRNQEEVMLWT